MINGKPILSIETSESLCGACVYFSDDKYFETNVRLKNSHAEKLFETIDFVVKSAGIGINDLDAIAVSAGPGSFTGLRIGMSAAKGIAFGSSLPIVPVPTFEAMALQLSSMLPENTIFTVANKVNTEEIYFAKFQIKSNNYIFTEDLRIVNHNRFLEESKGTLVFGNALKNLFDDGNSEQRNISAPLPVYVAKWCKLFGKNLMAFNFDYLEPNYLKNFIIKERKNV